MRTLVLAALLFAVPAQAVDLARPRARAPIPAPDAGQDAGAAREIVALIDRLSAAIQGHDTRTLAQVLLPDATITATRIAADGAPIVDRKMATEWLARFGAMTDATEERIERPDVTIADGAASASAPYRFFIGGKLHHCGTDFFQFVRTSGGWRMSSIVYNATTDGCAA